MKIFSLTPHDHRNDFQLAAAVRAVFQADLEDPLEQLGGGGGAVCAVLAVFGGLPKAREGLPTMSGMFRSALRGAQRDTFAP